MLVLTKENELIVKPYELDADGYPVLRDAHGNEYRPNGSQVRGVVVARQSRYR